MHDRTHPSGYRRHVVVTTLSGVLLLPMTAAAQSPDRIDLPPGWAPEGITTDGTSLFVGSLANGAIWRGDPASAEGSVLVDGAEGVVAVGVEYEPGARRLWVAGGDTGQVRAYDSESGELLATYPFEAGFVNDLVATPEAVYATDSFMPQVLVMPLGEDAALPDADETQVLPLSGDLEYGEGFNVNGIVATPAGLIVVHSANGELFRVDAATGESARIDIGAADLGGGDGMELDGQRLHVVRNSADLVVTLQLDEAVSTATEVATRASDDFDVPTTAGLVGSDLWIVNARFGTEAAPETEYWLTRLPTDQVTEEY